MLLKNATVHDGLGNTSRRDVLIENGRIARIAETIDGEGIRQALVETDIDWLPSGGRVTFDENRNPTKSMVVLQITDGLAKYVTTIAPED